MSSVASLWGGELGDVQPQGCLDGPSNPIDREADHCAVASATPARPSQASMAAMDGIEARPPTAGTTNEVTVGNDERERQAAEYADDAEQLRFRHSRECTPGLGLKLPYPGFARHPVMGWPACPSGPYSRPKVARTQVLLAGTRIEGRHRRAVATTGSLRGPVR